MGHYTDVDSARRLSGFPSANSVPDSAIDAILSYADAFVNDELGRTATGSLDPSDVNYPLARTAAEYIASSRIRAMFADKDKVADDHEKIAVDVCDRINRNGASGGLSPGIIIESQSFRTWPQNPNLLPFRSLRTAYGYSAGDVSQDWFV